MLTLSEIINVYYVEDKLKSYKRKINQKERITKVNKITRKEQLKKYKIYNLNRE